MGENKKIMALKKEIRDLSQMIVIYEKESKCVKNIEDVIRRYFLYNKRASVELLIKYCSLFEYDQNLICQKIWQMMDDNELCLTSDHLLVYNIFEKMTS